MENSDICQGIFLKTGKNLPGPGKSTVRKRCNSQNLAGGTEIAKELCRIVPEFEIG